MWFIFIRHEKTMCGVFGTVGYQHKSVKPLHTLIHPNFTDAMRQCILRKLAPH